MSWYKASWTRCVDLNDDIPSTIFLLYSNVMIGCWVRQRKMLSSKNTVVLCLKLCTDRAWGEEISNASHVMQCIKRSGIYPKIPNKGRTSNKVCAPLFWRNKMNWKIMGAHQIKVCANYLMCIRYYLGYSSAVQCHTTLCERVLNSLQLHVDFVLGQMFWFFGKKKLNLKNTRLPKKWIGK